MNKIKSLFRIFAITVGTVIMFGLLGLIGSSSSTAIGGNSNENAALVYENNALTEMTNAYGNFMNEIYPIVMNGERVDFNSITKDSLQKHLNKILDMYPNISPIKTIDSIRISSKFGWRTNPVTGVKHMHTGVDIDMPLGSEIHSTMSGIVDEVALKTKNGYGKYVVIKNTLGFTTLYSHMNRIDVKKGQEIAKNQVIGTLGATGNVTGANLHYEITHVGERKNPLDSLFMLKQSVKILSLKENSNENSY